jgi:type III restriction enzyme
VKIRFKHQPYQERAVEAIVRCFEGQPRKEGVEYRVDPGRVQVPKDRLDLQTVEEETGFRNHELLISDERLLQNIRNVQREQNLPVSSSLSEFKTIKKEKFTPDKSYTKKALAISRYHFDIEMETGTGKTYVYTKMIFEFYKKYGWSKYIIIVPSIAIREGVKQSFELTRDHFLEDYGERANVFIYDSKSPQNIKSFSTDGGIQVMIINIQAFNSTSKDAKRIYVELDEFESRRPIDMIKANRPILILDEPQKMSGRKTLESLQKFNALMVFRYSATHTARHHLIYRLDALDAYNQKLVKKIAVKGITVKGLGGTDAYLYLQEIVISKNRPPVARIEMEVKQRNGLKRIVKRLEKGDDLFALSNELEQYRGYLLSDIDALINRVEFTNGVALNAGEAAGDVSESMLRRIQIREAIKSHLQKEQELFYKGVKVLSLFFIDEVAKYRRYTEEGEEKGEYTEVFEEEYKAALNELGTLLEPEYREYLHSIDAEKTHNGYFSIDKKKNRLIDPKVKTRGEEAGLSDDADAYDLILKDKERLLSFEEPTRFIFSHSALREGWDNPNIFVICTLKHSDNTIARRQEVGRGMRISVNKKGERMDDPATVHDINVLTVVANESYKDFVEGLQKEIAATLGERPRVADARYFQGKIIEVEDGKRIKIEERQAKLIERYLIKNDYVDIDGHITEAYHQAKESDTLAPLPEELQEIAPQVITLIDSVYSDAMLPTFENEYSQKPNPLNNNLKKKEFLTLWENINRKAIYTVHFDSDELVDNAANALNRELNIRTLEYQKTEGEMTTGLNSDDIEEGKAFVVRESATIKDNRSIYSSVQYDLIGKLAYETKLTRRTIGKILQKISDKTFVNYRKNPEEFISNASRIINEQKAATVVEHLSYDKTAQTHRLEDIFTVEANKKYTLSQLQEASKHVYDYVATDSKVEKEFARELDTAAEVVVYAKLPKSFFIPTPVGHYNPDWAIAFEEGKVKHIYFVAETKGSMSTMELRKIEEIKIECAKKFFDKITTSRVTYDVVDSFESLMQKVM